MGEPPHLSLSHGSVPGFPPDTEASMTVTPFLAPSAAKVLMSLGGTVLGEGVQPDGHDAPYWAVGQVLLPAGRISG